MKNKSTTILLWVMFGLIILSIAATYYKTIVQRDFEIINDVEEEISLEE